MDSNTESFVSGGLATIMRVARIGGIAPLNFAKTRDGWRITFSSGWSIYGYFMITALNLVTSTSLVLELQMGQKGTRLSSITPRVMTKVQAVLMMIVSGLAVYSAPKLMKSMTTCLNQVQKINLELNIRHWPMSLGRYISCIAIVQAIVCLTLSVVDFAITVVADLQNMKRTCIHAMNIFYFLLYWILQLRYAQFIFIVLHVKYSFKVLNDHLMNILQGLDNFTKTPFNKEAINVINKHQRINNYVNTLSDSGQTGADTIGSKFKSNHAAVRRLALVFAALCDVVHDVDTTHGPMVLFMLTNFFLHLIGTPYFFIISLMDSFSSPCFISIQLLWCCYHTFNLVTIVEPCHLTHKEMDKTRELVGQLMRHTRSVDDPLGVELEQFFTYLVLNKVFYEPLKVIRMTRTLIFTFLGSITTYTVVILHF